MNHAQKAVPGSYSRSHRNARGEIHARARAANTTAKTYSRIPSVPDHTREISRNAAKYKVKYRSCLTIELAAISAGSMMQDNRINKVEQIWTNTFFQVRDRTQYSR